MEGKRQTQLSRCYRSAPAAAETLSRKEKKENAWALGCWNQPRSQHESLMEERVDKTKEGGKRILKKEKEESGAISLISSYRRL